MTTTIKGDNAVLEPTSLPTSGNNGEIRYDTTSKKFKFWSEDDSVWKDVSAEITEAILADEIATPSNPASGKVKYYFKNDGNLYKLNSAGVETRVGGGGGAGEINAIDNSDAEVNTEGWATYADAAGADPVDGDGGSPTVAFTRTTSGGEVLRGAASFKLAKDAADRQGEGASYAFTIDEADTNRLLKISFDYSVTANYASDDIGVYVYDVTNAELLNVRDTASNNTLSSLSRQGLFSFESSDSTSYRLIFHVKTTNASAYDLLVDNVIVGPGSTTIAQGAIVTEWQPITLPTTIPGGTQETVARRVGDSLEIKATFRDCTWDSVGLFIFELPSSGTFSGLTMDSSKLGHPTINAAGSAIAFDSSGSDYYGGTVSIQRTNQEIFIGGDSPSTFWSGSTSLPFDWFNGSDVLTFELTVPIAEWNSTGITILPTTDDLSINTWQDLNMTSDISGGTTVQTYRYKRVGQDMLIEGHVTCSASVSSTAAEFVMPAGFTIDTSVTQADEILNGGVYGGRVGDAIVFDNSVTRTKVGQVSLKGSDNRLKILLFNAEDVNTDTVTLQGLSAGSLATNDEWYFTARVPIVEWADLGTVPAVTIENATSEAPGLMGTGDQTFSGDKTFQGDISSRYFKYFTGAVTGGVIIPIATVDDGATSGIIRLQITHSRNNSSLRGVETHEVVTHWYGSTRGSVTLTTGSTADININPPTVDWSGDTLRVTFDATSNGGAYFIEGHGRNRGGSFTWE